MEYTKEVTEYINSSSGSQIPILEGLRKIVNDTVENATEAIKWKMPVFTQQKNFAYMQYSKGYVSFGLTNNIEKLKDPHQLLEGEGKTMKHVKITELDEELELQIKQWLKQITV